MTALDARVVSVVVPAYDRRHCVLDAIGSVLAQTHRHVECIVVDDGSVDGTFDALTRAYAGEPRVRPIAQDHQGVSAARNRGIREAVGEYVTFLDSDDLMPPDRIFRQLELLGERPCDAVFGTFESVVMPGVAPPDWLAARPDWAQGYSWTSVLVATTALRAVGGFDESLSVGEDVDLIVRLRHAGLRIGAVDETFVLRRIFGDNLTYGMNARDWVLGAVVRRHVARLRA